METGTKVTDGSGGNARQAPSFPHAQNTARGEDDHRIETVRKLLDMFWMERIVYLAISILSVGSLLWCAYSLIAKGGGGMSAEVTALFGSSGGIIYSTGRLLRMWSDAIKIVHPNLNLPER